MENLLDYLYKHSNIVTDAVVDDLVAEAAAMQATRINNQGYSSQLKYLSQFFTEAQILFAIKQANQSITSDVA